MVAKRKRQSNFELLRIVAMLMVVAHHFVRYAVPTLDAYSLDGRWLFFFVLESGGEVGVDVFLGISLWFLTARDLSLRTVRGHLLKTEAILLSYSIPICVLSRFHVAGLKPYSILRSCFPLVSSLWWFMTSYAFVLLMLPFLLKGLRALGQRMHAELVYLVVACVFALPMLPFSGLPFTALTSFFCLAIIIAYIRWYPNPLLEKPHAGWMLLLVSFVVNIGLGVLIKLGSADSPGSDSMRWLWYPGSLAVVGEALGLIVVFRRVRVQSRAINFVAQSTVGVYLLHEHPAIKAVLWRVVPFSSVYASSLWLLLAVMVVVGIYGGCTGVDMMRRALFSIVGRLQAKGLPSMLLTQNKADG